MTFTNPYFKYYVVYCAILTYVYCIIGSLYLNFTDDRNDVLCINIDAQCSTNYYVDLLVQVDAIGSSAFNAFGKSLGWPYHHTDMWYYGLVMYVAGIVTYPVTICVCTFCDMVGYGMYEKKKSFVE